MIRKPLPQIAAVLMLTASFGASADMGGVITGVGQWIAAQGNAALRQIGEDMKRDLAEKLKPLLPQAPAEKQPVDLDRDTRGLAP